MSPEATASVADWVPAERGDVESGAPWPAGASERLTVLDERQAARMR